jgi:uncharacterized protein (TIGR03492 family)
MRVLLLSNGHGEDLSGALLAEELIALGAVVEAMPLVGLGSPYRQRGIGLAGHTHEISTGGLGYTNAGGQLREIWEGQLSHLIRQLFELRRRRRGFDRVVAVGDVLPVLGAWLSGRPAAVYLVAYSSHYEGRLRLPWPCGWLLRQRCFELIWSRDSLTAADLTRQLGRPVSFVGNPFFDLVAAASDAPSRPQRQHVALLPGSRLPEAERNLRLLLALAELLPAGITLEAALVPGLSPGLVARLGQSCGWQLLEQGDGQAASLVCGERAIALQWGRFAAVLQRADLVVSMAGTASEQAVGLALPVVQLAGEGPQFTAGFAEAQRRLLGPGVFCAPGPPGAVTTLRGTAALIADLLHQLGESEQAALLKQQLTATASERIGPAGGSLRIAQALLPSQP